MSSPSATQQLLSRVQPFRNSAAVRPCPALPQLSSCSAVSSPSATHNLLNFPRRNSLNQILEPPRCRHFLDDVVPRSRTIGLFHRPSLRSAKKNARSSSAQRFHNPQTDHFRRGASHTPNIQPLQRRAGDASLVARAWWRGPGGAGLVRGAGDAAGLVARAWCAELVTRA